MATGAPAGGHDLRLDRVGLLGVRVVVDDDVGAFLREADGDGGADALAAAGDQCDLACEFAHGETVRRDLAGCKRFRALI